MERSVSMNRMGKGRKFINMMKRRAEYLEKVREESEEGRGRRGAN